MFNDLREVVRQEYPLATLSLQAHTVVDSELEDEIREVEGRNADKRFLIQTRVLDEIRTRNPLLNTQFLWGKVNQRCPGEYVHPEFRYARRRLMDVYNLN